MKVKVKALRKRPKTATLSFWAASKLALMTAGPHRCIYITCL